MSIAPGYYFHDHAVRQPDPLPEILEGLKARPRHISPKFFYDEKGSGLFTEITRLPEYYPTRTEIGVLRKYSQEIGELVGHDFTLIEYGSGSSEKIAILLDNLKPRIYAPIDISREYLNQSARSLYDAFPWLQVHATCADFTSGFELPFESTGRRIGFFPGSSIGNFSREEAASFLARIRRTVGDEGGLLLGVDLKKDPVILNAAYNDSQGVTAAFNLNILEHLNREFGADFDLTQYAHQAFYNDVAGAIQMFLVSQRDQRVALGGQIFELAAQEKIHTENSHKYSIEEIVTMASEAGFGSHQCWTDENALFAVFFFSNS